MRWLLVSFITGGLLGWISVSPPPVEPTFQQGRKSTSLLVPRHTASHVPLEINTLQDSEALKRWWKAHAAVNGEHIDGREAQVLRKWFLLDRHGALEIMTSSLGRGWLEALAALWAEADPHEAHAIFTHPNHIGGFGALVAAVVPGEERSFLEQLPTWIFGPPHHHNLGNVLIAWVDRDPELTLELLDELGPGLEHQCDQVLVRWSQDDASAAFTWAKASECERSIQVVGREWAKKDFQAAFEATEGLLELRDRLGFITEISDEQAASFIDWLAVHQDYTEHLSWLRVLKSVLLKEPHRLTDIHARLGHPSSSFGFGGMTEIVHTWAKEDERAALDWLQSLPYEEQAESARGMLQYWERQDPENAYAYVKQHFPTVADTVLRSGNDLNSWITTNFPGNDTTLFREWADTQPDDVRADEYERWVRTRKLSGDVEETDAFFAAFPPGDPYDRAIQHAVVHMMKTNRADAMRFVETLEPGVAKDYAMRNGLIRLTEAAPDEAIHWLYPRLSHLWETYPDAIHDSLERLAVSRPEQALDLLGLTNHAVAASQTVIKHLEPTRASLALLKQQAGFPAELENAFEADLEQREDFTALLNQIGKGL